MERATRHVQPELRESDPLATRLNGCGSIVDGQTTVLLSSALSPSWTLEPLDNQVVAGRAVSRIDVAPKPGPGTCARDVDLPALGRWRITTTVRPASGVPVSVAREQVFRDVLIAAVGDSFALG